MSKRESARRGWRYLCVALIVIILVIVFTFEKNPLLSPRLPPGLMMPVPLESCPWPVVNNEVVTQPLGALVCIMQEIIDPGTVHPYSSVECQHKQLQCQEWKAAIISKQAECDALSASIEQKKQQCTTRWQLYNECASNAHYPGDNLSGQGCTSYLYYARRCDCERYAMEANLCKCKNEARDFQTKIDLFCEPRLFVNCPPIK